MKQDKASGKAQTTNTEQQTAAVTELIPITDTLRDNYMPYVMSVIVSRAIPEIDGFKPSQRKLLYTMYKMGLSKGPRAKSADVVGQTMALNPHGDQSIYETMVRMTRGNGALLNPWIDSKGNFGRVYSRDMQCAAYRYTEARLDPSCELLFAALDKNAVDFTDNYSGTMKEPRLLPSTVPSILINSNQGIAVGMASNIASFNLRECCLATIALLDDENADLLAIMPAPDFATAAVILYDQEQMRQIYETGKGSFRMQAVANIIKKENRIEITEIPYNTTVEAIIDEITNQIKKNKLKEIVDVRDETDLNGLRLTIDLKKGSEAEFVLQKLFLLTPLECSFTCNFNLLIDNRPVVLGVRAILLEWLKWRRSCRRREIEYEQAKIGEKLNLLRALELILLDIDRAIRIIRKTEREDEVVPQLRQAFGLSDEQANYVAEIRLRQLNREYLLRRTEEIAGLEDELRSLTAVLQNPKKLDKLLQRELKAAADKYARERKTILVPLHEVVAVEKEDMIEDYRVRFFFTKEGYLKKLALTSLRSAVELKLKENDSIAQELEGSNKSNLLFFSNKGQVYKLRAYELNDHKPSDYGDYTPNILELDEGERILFCHVCDDNYGGYLLLSFANGKALKVEVKAYETKNRRKKLLNAFYDGASLKSLHYLSQENGNGDYFFLSTQDRLILIDSDLIPFKRTKNSQGIQVMTLRKGHEVKEVFPLEAVSASEQVYYRVRSLPAAGRFVKEGFLKQQQVSIDSLCQTESELSRD